jgi:dihydroflavonol-4-reductase
VKVLVTGATGFLGGAVVRALVRARYKVRALVRPTSVGAARLRGRRIDVVAGDVLDRGSLHRAFAGVDAVVHAAAFMSFRPRDAAQVRLVNVEGTRHVLEAAAAHGVRVLHTSTIATVGLTARPTALDESSRALPDAVGIPYVSSKIEAERLALELASRGADTVVLNPGILLGAGDVHLTSTRSIVASLHAPLVFYPEGGASLGEVANVAAAYVAALERGRAGQRYLLAGTNTSYRELLTTVARLCGKPAPLPLPGLIAGWWAAASARSSWLGPHPFEEFNPGIVAYTRMFNYCDCGKAERELGFEVAGLDGMLRDTVIDLLSRGLVTASTPELWALRVAATRTSVAVES